MSCLRIRSSNRSSGPSYTWLTTTEKGDCSASWPRAFSAAATFSAVFCSRVGSAEARIQRSPAGLFPAPAPSRPRVRVRPPRLKPPPVPPQQADPPVYGRSFLRRFLRLNGNRLSRIGGITCCRGLRPALRSEARVRSRRRRHGLLRLLGRFRGRLRRRHSLGVGDSRRSLFDLRGCGNLGLGGTSKRIPQGLNATLNLRHLRHD